MVILMDEDNRRYHQSKDILEAGQAVANAADLKNLVLSPR